ncbi:hypothetical protein SAMD00019534_075940 [Acytostelium subglobosum LB1]|uniref:hypothetical protein n=1 Tax=Acytostelium subglobosum LB1 TaxID=1410327 RepID=UPI00064516B4|nr:hypothetical protein SAMD00019534_075940 [Acytostelium subglobosum LB1]GAM24419.1 hypothetical protein SAMD00019534_075940 [Acytostelium subglobosum LB1]|eukprot:XP_012752745.1 hypothetical protein SAMD00019534_075940 [Acytostelium subglobosum LB1]
MQAGSDPLSILAAEQEENILKAQKAREAAEAESQQQQQLLHNGMRRMNLFEEEERRLESITKLHLHDPNNIGINANINSLEIKDKSKITKKKWINALCTVNFDLEIGQILDYSHPKLTMREEEIKNLCFLSFPDSNSHLQGDIIYSFKLKCRNQDDSVDNLNGSGNGNHANNNNNNNGANNNNITHSYQYGYVFFRQEKDPSLPRGYLQKSVVLLSDEHFVGLFKKVMEIIGPLYFQHGETLLEVAYQNMMSWPELRLGQSYELPILGSIFNFHVPYTTGAPHIIDPVITQQQMQSLKADISQVSVSNLQSIDLYTSFKGFPSKLWMLWEMVLLGHPIIVVSPTPPTSSDAVLALVSLISPLNYCNDYRPYFTIHDPDFHKYTATSTSTSTSNKTDPPASIIGVTNPFFLKALSHWPTIVSIGSTPKLGRTPTSSPKDRTIQQALQQSSSSSQENNDQKVVTEFKTHTSPDKAILKKITDTQATCMASHNETLRKHFFQLTLNFLIPLERYFSSLLPLAKTISVFNRPPKLKNFDTKQFIETLQEGDVAFVSESKSKDIELYKEFLETANFKNWLDEKRREATRHLNLLYRKAILESNIPALLKNKSPSVALDLYKRVYDQLILEEILFQTPEDIRARIKDHLEQIRPYLPQ